MDRRRAGVIGIEYASMFAALGCKVTVVEQRDRMLELCDLEVVGALRFHLRADRGRVCRYRELARGQIIGDSYGVLETARLARGRSLLGVHESGTQATELVHIGRAVMGCGEPSITWWTRPTRCARLPASTKRPPREPGCASGPA